MPTIISGLYVYCISICLFWSLELILRKVAKYHGSQPIPMDAVLYHTFYFFFIFFFFIFWIIFEIDGDASPMNNSRWMLDVFVHLSKFSVINTHEFYVLDKNELPYVNFSSLGWLFQHQHQCFYFSSFYFCVLKRLENLYYGKRGYKRNNGTTEQRTNNIIMKIHVINWNDGKRDGKLFGIK